MEAQIAPMARTKQGEFCLIDVVATDLDGQTRFYEALFGWTHTDLQTQPGPYRMFQKDGLFVAAMMPMSPEMAAQRVPSMWNTYVAVDDIDAVLGRTAQLGGQVATPARDAMSAGRTAAIADPTGGRLFLWQAKDSKGAQLFGKPGSLMWNDLSTRDPEQAAAFYTQLFGWKIDELEGGGQPYWQASVDGQPEGGIMPMPQNAPAQMPASWMVYFGVEDVRGFAECAAAAGGRTLMEPMETAGVTFGIFSDPAGAVFAVMQPMQQA